MDGEMPHSEHARAGDDPVGLRVAALGAAATLVSGRGANRSDRDSSLLVRNVLDLADQFTGWLATGRRG